MRINTITCSDPRDHNSYQDLVGLWETDPDRVEVAVQMHPGKVSPGTARYEWVKDVVDKLSYEFYRYHFAMHINGQWCNDICNGKIPDELRPMFDARWLFENHAHLVSRIQLNMPADTAKKLNPHVLKSVIESFPNQEFIIQYNDNTKDAVRKLNETGVWFTTLYDASGGRGILPKSWDAPVRADRPMGYAGGLSPENVKENLTKISSHVSLLDDIWVDAEGKLKTDDKFDVARAIQYVKNVKSWDYNQWFGVKQR